ncbi:MAG: hypothetical protein V1810_00570 [Candidatus Beckwithbacteria bacterium]
MSKKFKWLIIGLIVLISAGAGWWLLKPKASDSFVEKEISIKQARPGVAEILTWQDLSGFSFEYSADLKIAEIELDEPTVYSSLEMSGSEPGKLTLRISDTKFNNINTWQKDFEKKEVINELRIVSLDDLSAIQFEYQAPKLRKTVGIDNKIIYELEAPADDGYWDNMSEMIRQSFKFDESIYAKPKTAEPVSPGISNSEEVILLEEKYE